MIRKITLILSAITFCLALLLFAIHKELIIINFQRSTLAPSSEQTTKKQIPLYYWHNESWHSETVIMLISSTIQTTAQQLVSRWLQLILDEKIITKKVNLQAVLLSYDNQELFLSFDRAPWNKTSSTFEKWMAIEGILKTIKEPAIGIKKVRFLINHQPLQDYHLDFTNAWPIDGFNPILNVNP